MRALKDWELSEEERNERTAQDLQKALNLFKRYMIWTRLDIEQARKWIKKHKFPRQRCPWACLGVCYDLEKGPDFCSLFMRRANRDALLVAWGVDREEAVSIHDRWEKLFQKEIEE